MIALRQLSCVRGDFTLGPLDLELPSQAYLAIVGPSGHGKTTLLGCLAGILPASGSIDLDGLALHELPAHRRQVGLVPQGGLLFPHLDVRQNIAYAGTASREEVEAIARTWECEALLDRHVGDLSGGERMRVALARAMACNPRLLLLDEPLASLDAASRSALRERLLAERGKRAIVHVTHDLDEASALSTHLAVLERGRCISVGATGEMLEPRPSAAVARLLGVESLLGGS
jgi:molybdate transport system ATP-binding protein